MRFRLRLALLAALCIPAVTASAQSGTGIARLNDAIVFDLFMNYELTEKNGNSSTLMDYLPSAGRSDVERMEMSSNYGGEREATTFSYAERGLLDRIVYQREGRVFTYDLAYENGRPASASIAGRKIGFGYRNDTLVSITRERNGGVFEYGLEYRPGENRADIKLIVVVDGKRRSSSSTYHVTWDDRNRLTGYSLGTYTGRDVTYSDAGDVATFSYFTHDDEKRTATWEYVRDAKSNWTERRFNKLAVKRSIQYRKR